MSFSFPSLFALGLPLIALPLLIHLINLRRHRRVAWAAMDFLLESQQRNKRWILLRQLLLLLLRTAAIALIVAMLAGPVLKFQWGQLVGKGTTHHWVLLDDSYSMSDAWDETSALAEAQRVLTQLLTQATEQPGDQKLTLLRFSQAEQWTAGGESTEQPLNRQTLQTLLAQIGRLTVAESDVGPLQAIQAALGLPEPTAGETLVVTLISDFRQAQWQNQTELNSLLRQLRQRAARLELVQCVDATRPNLAILELQPESGVRAAGVETWMELTVANFGNEAAPAVTAEIWQDGHKLPAVALDTLEPGERATRRFRVAFAAAGSHQLEARLPRDAIALDNQRYFTCEVPAEFPVLLIDGSRDGDDSYYLRTSLSPGGGSNTGWKPQVQRPEFLRKHRELQKFAAICLLDVARLDDPEVAALEEYVRQGGGLGVFVGPRVQKTFYNQRLYREGAGLLPVPLHVPTELLALTEQGVADVQVSDHPLFRVFGGQRNSFLALATVRFYVAVDPHWQLPTDKRVGVLAQLRNGAPLVVEQPWGKGRVVLQLSKLSPQPTDLGSWNNWSLNPVFPVYANELIGYLSSYRRQRTGQEVGDELTFDFPTADYEPEAEVHLPINKGGEVSQITPKVEAGHYLVHAGPARVSGVWELALQSRAGDLERRHLAVNLPTGDSDLHHLDRDGLARQLPGLDYQFSLATQITTEATRFAGFALGDTCFYLLLATLLLEQGVATWASYHSQPTSRR